MPKINDHNVPDGDDCVVGGTQCEDYEETSKACYLFGQKIEGCHKCAECTAASKG